ncbi:hypothetical protein AURANDRAFT_33110, partial [Aureococcus anophagefferens]
LSYTLGLVGSCYSIDTACASALAALHLCATTVQDSCTDGIGVGTKILTQITNLAMSVAAMLSLAGRCHTFDRRANGYCRAEGCAALLL